MAVIKLKGKRNYYIKVQEGSTQVCFSTRTTNRKLADKMFEIFLLQWMTEKMKGVPLREFYDDWKGVEAKEKMVPRDHSVARVYKKWTIAGESQGVTNATLRMRKILIEHLEELGITSVQEIDQRFVHRYKHFLEKRNHKAGTMKNRFAMLKAFLNYASKIDCYSFDKVNNLTFPRFNVESRKTEIKESEYKEMLSLTDDVELQWYLRLLWETGGRRNEIAELNLENFKAEGSYIKLYGQKTKSWREVPLRREFAKELGVYTKQRMIDGKTEFFSFSGSYYYMKFKELMLKKAEWETYVIHSFRHSYITRMLRAGHAPEFVGKIVGHTDTSQIYNTYDQRSIEDFVEEINRGQKL